MVTINRQSMEQLPDPSARLTLSVENLTFIRLLQFQLGYILQKDNYCAVYYTSYVFWCVTPKSRANCTWGSCKTSSREELKKGVEWGPCTRNLFSSLLNILAVVLVGLDNQICIEHESNRHIVRMLSDYPDTLQIICLLLNQSDTFQIIWTTSSQSEHFLHHLVNPQTI